MWAGEQSRDTGFGNNRRTAATGIAFPFTNPFTKQESSMRTEIQGNAGLSRLCKLIAHVSAAMLTNLDGEGNLVSRPMAPLEMDRDGAIWFFTDLRSSKVEHLRVANLSFTDPSRGTYVSVSGKGEVFTERARIDRLWTPFARPWFPEGPDSPHLGLLRITPATAEYWDASHCKMVHVFAMAASVVAGKPVGLGEHGTLTDLSRTAVSV